MRDQPIKKPGKFWDNAEFLQLLTQFDASRNNKIMDQIAEGFFVPLALWVVNRLTLHPSLDKNHVAMESVVHCWQIIDRFDRKKHNPMAYFTRCIKRYALHCNRREVKRAKRYLQDDDSGELDE